MGRRRCGWCYGWGHNRATCEEYTKQVKEQADWEVENNKGRERVGTWDRYHQKEYAKRMKSDTLLDGTKLDKPISSRRKSTRTCSFCGHSGHNRRKCEDFANHSEKVIKLTSDYRKAIKKQMKDSGWGVGALVQELYRGEVNENCSTYMIVDMDLDTASMLSMECYSNRQPIVKMININPNPKYSWDKEKEMNLPPLAPENFPKSVDRYSEYLTSRLVEIHKRFPQDYELISGVEDGIVYPKGWTGLASSAAATGLEKSLKEATAPNFYENQRRSKESDW